MHRTRPSFSERGGTASAVGDSRRKWLVGRVVQRSSHATMQGTLTSQRVLYPPPQAVPLLPHGRRLFFAPLALVAWAVHGYG